MFCRVGERGNFTEYSKLVAVLLVTVKKQGKLSTYFIKKERKKGFLALGEYTIFGRKSKFLVYNLVCRLVAGNLFVFLMLLAT